MTTGQRKNTEVPLCEATTAIRGKWPSLTCCPVPFVLACVHLPRLGRMLADERSSATATQWLTGEETRQLARYHHAKRRVEWLGGRIAAKYAALRVAGVAAHAGWPGEKGAGRLEIRPDSGGKPLVSWRGREKPAGTVHLSISHGSGWAVALAAGSACGVDIQAITPAVERVRERFIRPDEAMSVGTIAAIHDQRAALTCIWSAKEAVKKAAPGPVMPGFFAIRIHGLRGEGGGLSGIATIAAFNGQAEISLPVWLKKYAGRVLALTMRADGDGHEENP